MKKYILILCCMAVSVASYAADDLLESTFFESNQSTATVTPSTSLQQQVEKLFNQQLNAENSGRLITAVGKEQVKNEFWYVIILSLLCLISLGMILLFLKGREHNAKDIVNAAGLTLIIFGTIILVLVVDTTEQLTAAIGILGAIAGYLFRSAQENDMSSRDKNNVGPAEISNDAIVLNSSDK